MLRIGCLSRVERKIVVAKLELGRIEIAEVFELCRPGFSPAAVRTGEAYGSKPELRRIRWADSRLTRLASGSR